MTHLIAIYGTLRKGHPNHFLLNNAPIVGKGHIASLRVKDLTMTGEIGASLTVEVYSVNNDTFHQIDEFEASYEFTREERPTQLDNKTIITSVWIRYD